MRYTILIVAISLIFFGCKKDKSSRPVLSFKSVNSTTINDGDLLIFTLSFKNIKPSIDDTLNIKELVPCALSQFSQNYGLPVFSAASNQGGTITVSFINNVTGTDYPILGAKCDSDDICHFQFILVDQYHNKSDTVLSPAITIKQ
jgi:hypothetical protein